MRLFPAQCTTPTSRPWSPLSSGCFLGPILMLVVILITYTDACDDSLPQFPGMKIKGDIKSSYSPGERVEFECRLGYKKKDLRVNMTTVCLDNNTWSYIEDGCKKKSCSNPGDFVNGHIEFLDNNFELGSRIKYICDEGFNLVGSDAIQYCEISGTSVAWNQFPPVCDKAKCAPPPNIDNGSYNNVKDVYEYNEVVTYSCNPATGADEFSLIGNKSLFCSTDTNWSSDPPKCKVVKCPSPTIENGEQASGFARKYSYNAQVTFRCLSNFVMDGSNTVVCGEDNAWVPEIPKCIKAPATPSAKPPSVQPPSANPPSAQPPPSARPPPSAQPPPSTQPPFSSHPATTPMITTPNAGVFPTGPPVSSVLDGGTIAVIVVSILVAVTVVSIFLYKYRHSRKRGKAEVTAAYTTCKNTSVSPAEQES